MRKGKLFLSVVVLCALTMVVSLAVCGCGEKDKSGISSITPSSGEAGTEVIISGSHFGETQGTSTVEFGTVTAQVESWSDSEIKVNVPSEIKEGEYEVTVSTEAGTSDKVGFEVTGAKKSETSDRKPGHVEHNTPLAAILEYCKKNNIDTTGMTFSVLTVSKSDPNWKIDLGHKAGQQAESMQFLLHKVNEEWTVVQHSAEGWTAEQLKALGAPDDMATMPNPQPAGADQVKAILGYLQSKGEPTQGWTFTLVKVSATDPNWEVIKGTYAQSGKSEQFLLIFNNMLGDWEVLASGEPPWTGVEFKGEPVPADLNNV